MCSALVQRGLLTEHGQRDGGPHGLAGVDGLVPGLARVVGAVVAVRGRQPDLGRHDELAGAGAPRLGHHLGRRVLALVCGQGKGQKRGLIHGTE